MTGPAYVYAITVNGVVRYIGKGSGQRLGVHVRNARQVISKRSAGEKVKTAKLYNRLAKAMLAGSIVEVFKLHKDCSHEQAYEIEKRLVAETQNLWNEKEGGEGGKLTSKSLRNRLSKIAKRRFADPDERARMAALSKAGCSKPEVLKKRRADGKKLWSDPVYAERTRKKIAATKATPKSKEKRSKAGKRAAERCNYRELNSAKNKEIWSDTERLAVRTGKLKTAWQREETRKRHESYLASDRGRENLRRAAQARWAKVKDAKMASAET